MKDLFSPLLKFLDHYRYTVGLLLVGIAVMVSLFGCQTTTSSILDPSKEVSAHGLQLEATQIKSDLASERAALDAMIAEHNGKIEAFNEKLELAQADIERKEAVKAELLNIGGSVAVSVAEGSVNPASLVGTGLTALALALGIGASADNRRKDSKIKELKKVSISTGSE